MSPRDDSQATGFATLRRLLKDYGRRHGFAYLAALVFLGLGSAATALVAYLLKPVLNHMVEPDGLRSVRVLSVAVACLFGVRAFSSYFSQVILARAGARIVADAQLRLFDHMMDQDLAFLRDRHSSEYLARLAGAANGARDALQTIALSIGRDAITLLCLALVMFVQDVALALIALALMPVAGFWLGQLVRTVRQLTRRSFDGSARVLRAMQETLTGVRVVKSFTLEDEMRARAEQASFEVERAANRAAARRALASPLADLTAGLGIAFILFYGAWRVSVAGADPGAFFSFVVAMVMAYEPGKKIARAHLELQAALANARAIYEVLDAPAAESPRPGAPALQVGEGRIAFEGVRFSYRAEEHALDDLDVVFEPARTTALVGPSGAGKSTVVNLLQRFYAPQAGRILVDGQDISGVDLRSLRRAIAYVPQDVFLFDGAIGENIRLGRLDASDEDVVNAARRAHADGFIRALGDGYDTQVGEMGENLSGGQKARIAIARALLKDAPILVLDEPTAALDSESEREVQTALEELRRGRTTLVIAHRMQTILAADWICVIEGGRLATQGRHEDLIARSGLYKAFVDAQFGGKSAP